VCVCVSQVIGCEDRLRNDLYCVGWGVKLYSNQTQLMPLPLTVSCFSKIQIGFTFLVLADPGSHGKRPYANNLHMMIYVLCIAA